MKICIITDERTGGTCFASMFSGCNLVVCQDPQTSSKKKFNKEFKCANDMLNFIYKTHDVVKLSYISFSIKEYTSILDYCIQHNIVIIVLHRNNIYSRAQSKCVAQALAPTLGHYNVLDTSKTYKPFNIPIEKYRFLLHNYNNHIVSHINYLNKNNKPYYFIVYEELYSNISLIYELFQHLSLTVNSNEHIENILNIDYKTDLKNKLILNQNDLTRINRCVKRPNLVLTNSIVFLK